MSLRPPNDGQQYPFLETKGGLDVFTTQILCITIGFTTTYGYILLITYMQYAKKLLKKNGKHTLRTAASSRPLQLSSTSQQKSDLFNFSPNGRQHRALGGLRNISLVYGPTSCRNSNRSCNKNCDHCNTIQYNTIQCNTIHYNNNTITIQYTTITIQYTTITVTTYYIYSTLQLQYNTLQLQCNTVTKVKKLLHHNCAKKFLGLS